MMSQSGKYILTGTSGPVNTLTGNSGGAVNPTLNNINIVGAGGVTVAGNNGTSTLTISLGGAGFTWTVVTAGAQTIVAENGYIANNGGTLVFTLPVTATVGDTFIVTGINNNTGWKIAQNAGQTIYLGSSQTTTGATGFLQSTNTRDSVEIVCVVQNTGFNVISSIGNVSIN